YLVGLLAASSTEADIARYSEYETIHTQIRDRWNALDRRLQDLVALRNDVDQLEQRVEQVRQEVGEEAFRSFRDVGCAEVEQRARLLQTVIDQADLAKQAFTTRLIWPLICSRRFARLTEASGDFQQTAQDIGLPIPGGEIDLTTVGQWIQYGSRLATRTSLVVEVKEYFEKLTALTQSPSLGELSRQWRALTEELRANSERLWETWLRLQPSRMSPAERNLLGQYSALLNLLANGGNQQPGQRVLSQYRQLFPQITTILSCWAVTSLSARGRVPFTPSFFDLLVIDEASQCDIASALPLLYRARQVVIIGDPMQLRHISTLPTYKDQQLLSKHDLIDDYPAWAYSHQSLFDLATSLCRSEDIVALRDHHRSHADIIEFSNETFYERRLRVATNYDRLRRPRPDEPAVRWVHVQGKAVRPGTGGAVNEEEAHKVVSEIERLLSQGYCGSIGVVSPFRAQANRIRDLVYQNDGLSRRIAEVDFLADTVHKFQGDERDVMIFSPAISPGVDDRALGFLRSNPNLFNVAITRARAALIVVGDQATARSCGVDFLSKFASYVDRVRDGHRASKAELRAELGPEYPAVAQPELVSDWERLFYRALYQHGVHPIPQYSVEKYLLDLAVIAGDRRLDIEVDGERYHRNWDGELCRRDQIRNQRLMELSWDVMRFWVYQIRDDLPNCLTRVQNWIEA
ncbi:MAG: AAA domain-containing protein, partial [Dehalococcoidales bacterium]|nr:AAA domain-containing protein [Dehalococcoidales bacterium]